MATWPWRIWRLARITWSSVSDKSRETRLARIELVNLFWRDSFNPRPIKVSQAEAAQEGATTKVFLELRDVQYPGSTYTLRYDPASDQLKGVYYQAALQQSFNVVFVRMK